MKKTFLFFFAAAACMAQIRPQAAWTVMLFMNATDPALVCDALRNIQAIKQFSVTPRVNYLVELGRVLREPGAECSNDEYPLAGTLRFPVSSTLEVTPSNSSVKLLPGA